MATPAATEPLVITALGMVSSLGLDVVSSCAAARAGLLRPTPLEGAAFGNDDSFGSETYEGPAVLSGHSVDGIGAGFTGIGKLLRLGGAALRDLLERRPLEEREESRTGLYLAVSDSFVRDTAEQREQEEEAAAGVPGARGAGPPPPSARWRQQVASLPSRLLNAVGLSRIHEQQLLLDGHAGVASALAAATTKIQRGTLDRAIIGGLESRVEPAFLMAAAALGILKTSDNPVGLSAGEGAAFLLVERARDATRCGLRPLAELRGVAFAADPVHHLAERPCDGTVLADVVRTVLESDPDLRSSFGLFVGDLDGTERRAVDWGSALVRLRATLGARVDAPLWLPVASFGDTGAATGAIAVCLLARAFERRYAPASGAVVWLSSESGKKGAVGIRAALTG